MSSKSNTAKKTNLKLVENKKSSIEDRMRYLDRMIHPNRIKGLGHDIKYDIKDLILKVSTSTSPQYRVPMRALINNLLNLRKQNDIYVEIYLPNANKKTDAKKIQRLKKALYHYLDSADIIKNEEKESSEIFGSWAFIEWFKSKIPSIGNESKEVYQELREAARRASIDKQGSQNMLNRAKATKELLDSIKDIDEAIIRLGDVVLAKAVVNGKPRIIVVTLSSKLARDLDANPQLLKDPLLFIEHTRPERKPREMIARKNLA